MAINYIPEDNSSFRPNDYFGTKEELENSKNLFSSEEMVKLVQTYLEEDVPTEFRDTPLYKQFWGVLGKTIKLSFLDKKEDLYDFECFFEQTKLNYMLQKPSYEFSFEDQQMLEQLRIYYRAALSRAFGAPQHRFNERIILGGQINQVIRSNVDTIRSSQPSGRGFLAGIRNMF